MSASADRNLPLLMDRIREYELGNDVSYFVMRADDRQPVIRNGSADSPRSRYIKEGHGWVPVVMH